MAKVSAGSAGPAGPGTDMTAAGSRTTSSRSSADSNSSVSAKFPFAQLQSEPEVTVPTSLLNFLFAEQQANTCSLDLAELINSIQAAIKAVNADLRLGGLRGNNKRKVQEKVETILTNFIHASNPAACMLLTPNRQFPIRFDNNKRAKFAVCVQPLEGAFGGTHTPLFAGTVFGVHKVGDGRSSKEGKVTLRSPLLPGRHLVAAGYALYGITTTLVLSLGRKSNIFVLDPATGEFMLNNQPLTVPPKGQVYNVNEGHIYEWNPAIIDYIESKKDSKFGKAYRSEHFGCVVADVHFTLLQGGICMLPKIRSQPAAQLSVLLCLAPLAYVACVAGGLASNGEVAILDICPESITQTTPAFIGSREDVRELLTCLGRRKSSSAKSQDVRATKPSSVPSSVQPAVKNESKLPPSDSPARSYIWRPSMDSTVQLAAKNESTSDSRVRSQISQASTDSDKEQTVPMGRSHLTIPPMSPKGSGVTNKIKQTSACVAPIDSNSALAPVAPLTTVKNDRIRLTWPAFGSIVPKLPQKPTRKL